MAVPIGILLVWLGYGIGYYGFNRITGGNDKWISLVMPGRYTPTPRDGDPSGGVAANPPGTLPTPPAQNPVTQAPPFPSGPPGSVGGGPSGTNPQAPLGPLPFPTLPHLPNV